MSITKKRLVELAIEVGRNHGNQGQEGGTPFIFSVDELEDFAQALLAAVEKELGEPDCEFVRAHNGNYISWHPTYVAMVGYKLFTLPLVKDN